MLIQVAGGTGAGRRMHRRAVPKTTWTCTCGRENLPNAVTCLGAGCREKRR